MNITEMIKQLEELREKHGDLPVGCIDDIGFCHPVTTVELAEFKADGMLDLPFIFISA